MARKKKKGRQSLRYQPWNFRRFEIINKKNKEISQQRGENNEKKVAQALLILKEEGKIKNFRQTEKGGKEDKTGKDFIIYLNEGGKTYLQVKSSKTGVEKHKLQNSRLSKYGKIPVIQIDSSESIKEIVKKIRKLFFNK